jgi:hypothetical protein
VAILRVGDIVTDCCCLSCKNYTLKLELGLRSFPVSSFLISGMAPVACALRWPFLVCQTCGRDYSAELVLGDSDGN